MPAERLSMRKIREVLRLRGEGRTLREIARSVGVGYATVSGYLGRAKVAGISWPLPVEFDDAELEKRLFVDREDHRPSRPLPDWTWVHAELRRKHVTLALLWEEYRQQHPEGYQYSQFCDLYRRWAGTLQIWMRQEHRPGEKAFVDFSGDGIPWVDPKTGQVHEAQLFVGVMGASNYTYAQATATQQLRDWIASQVRMFEYFGGVPALLIPDQPKSIVRQSSRYDPSLNATYLEMAGHYGTCIFPARPRRPRDKAKVEAGVLVAQRWIIARLRNRALFSLDEVDEAVSDLLDDLNGRKMRKLGRSRRDLFLEVDKPALKPLPGSRYEFAEWKIGARVNLDYHVEFENNFYSVPFQHAREAVDIRAAGGTIEVFLRSRRIASHRRSYGEPRFTTLAEHMPRAHQEHMEWSPSRIVKWAQTIGPSVAQMVERILSERPHPEQGYRACLGILRLSKTHSDARLERACARALACRSHSYRAVESILKNHLEDKPFPRVESRPLPLHENVRGAGYYN